MVYIFSFVSGVINGLFASGAGQILVFFLIYIAKIDTHKARATSMLCMSLTAILSFIRYIKMVEVKILNIVIVAICGLVLGALGAKIMNKIESNALNILSGLIIFGLSLYNIFAR